MKHLLTAETPVRECLRLRPLSLELFAKRGLDCWSHVDKPLRFFFPDEASGALAAFLEEFEIIPVPLVDSRWQELPVAHLLDFLTQEHREFLLNSVTDIAYVIDVQGLVDAEVGSDVRRLQAEFQDFVAALRSELEQEETRVFRRILRYDACLRDARVHPEFQQGSLQFSIAMRAHRFTAMRHKTFPALLALAHRAEQSNPENSGLTTLAERLRDFDQRLETHERLEMDALFPMALAMERTLYNLTINGSHAADRVVRGPMDSGILRLRGA